MSADDVQRLIASLSLTAPATFEDLVKKVAALYGKPINFEPVSSKGWGELTALWLDRKDEGIIFYRPEHPWIYQQHNFFHEFGHILFQHTGCHLFEAVGKNVIQSVGIERGIGRVLARGGEIDELELAAEQVAFALAAKVLQLPLDNQRVDEVFG